jgi:fluoroacetyl-CoA thioesterase
MKQLFKAGDKKEYSRKVTREDFASFGGETVHPVCATFSLARDIEWTTRQFVLEMRDDDEEGVGTFISIEHLAPAFEGDEIVYSGYVDNIDGTVLTCTVDARVGDRLVARATTGQKILKREKIKQLFAKP